MAKIGDTYNFKQMYEGKNLGDNLINGFDET